MDPEKYKRLCYRTAHADPPETLPDRWHILMDFSDILILFRNDNTHPGESIVNLLHPTSSKNLYEVFSCPMMAFKMFLCHLF